jgi:flagellin-like protein
MFEDTDNRGQVGIGTLIVFIAMVLVAAIAAGVLVNTAGFLQENAEQTGQQAQGEVSDRVQVVSAYAIDTDDTPSGAEYDELNITIRKASGSDDINISDITFTYLGPSTTDSGKLGDLTNDRNAVSGNPDYLRNESDRVQFTIDVDGDDVGTGGELAPGTEFELQLTTSSGASTYIEGRIPETAESGGVVEV